MKRLRKIIILTISLIFVTLNISLATNTNKKTITRVEPMDNVFTTDIPGYFRGRYMDRVSTGIAVSGDSVIRVRTTNGVGATMSLMTNNHRNDIESGAYYTDYKNVNTVVPSTGEWIEIRAVADSGVFVKKNRNGEEATIEVEVISGNSYDMPKYTYGSNLNEFINTWKNSNSPFSIIYDKHITIFLPIYDMKYIEDKSINPKFFDELIDKYNSLIDTYDNWLGLENIDDSHKNSNMNYFIRPDIAGKEWGLAYYLTASYVGTNNESVNYYLKDLGWIILHEIGHGYDGPMISKKGGSDMDMLEVWNNIYAHNYQNSILKSNDLWLYGRDKEGYRLNRDNIYSQGNTNFNSLDPRTRLDVVTRMTDLVTMEGFRNLNRLYREDILKDTLKYKNIPVKDIILEYLGLKNGYNFMPYLENFMISPSDNLRDRLLEYPTQNAYILRYLVNDDTRAKQLASNIGKSQSEMLTNDFLNSTSAKGSFKIQLNKMINTNLKASLWDNGKKLYEGRFEGNNIIFENIPIGAYTIRYPILEDGSTSRVDYVVVKEGDSGVIKNAEFNNPEFAPSSNVEFDFRGLGDSSFAKLTLDFQNKKIKLNSTGEKPHVYFSGALYSNIKIENEGQVIYEKSFIGDSNLSVNDVIDLPIGSIMTIYHAEHTTRLKEYMTLTNKEEPLLEQSGKTTSYILTENGLQILGRENDSAEISKKTMALALENFAKEYNQNNSYIRAKLAQSFLNTIKNMEKTSADEILSTYGNILNENVNAVGTEFKLNNEVVSEIPPVVEKENPPVEKNIGWVKNQNIWNYYDKDGTMVKSKWKWLPILDANGVETNNYNWKFFNSKGESMEQIYTENGKSWLSLSGPTTEYQRGWWVDPENGYKYYFRISSGSKVSGRQFIDGGWKYFRQSGTQAFGWQYYDNAWKYNDPQNDGNEIISNWKWILVSENPNLYNWKYFNAKGESINQIYTENSKTWLSLKGPNTQYQKGWWINPENGYKYYFRINSGSMVTGWQFIDNGWRYFRNSGTMVAGVQYIDGKIRKFDNNGLLIGKK